LSTSTPFFSLTGCPPILWGLDVWASARGLWVIDDIGYGYDYCFVAMAIAFDYYPWPLVFGCGY